MFRFAQYHLSTFQLLWVLLCPPVQAVGLADVVNASVFTVGVGAGSTTFSLIALMVKSLGKTANTSHCTTKVEPRLRLTH